MAQPAHRILRAAFLSGLLLCPACGGLPSHPDDLGLLPVLSVTQGVRGPYEDKDRCQIVMDVMVMMPDCGAFGKVTERIDGNTFHFEAHASYYGACAGSPTESGFGICLPGNLLGPAPPIPTGTYFVEVNGVTGTFTVP